MPMMKICSGAIVAPFPVVGKIGGPCGRCDALTLLRRGCRRTYPPRLATDPGHSASDGSPINRASTGRSTPVGCSRPPPVLLLGLMAQRPARHNVLVTTVPVLSVAGGILLPG